VLGCVGAERRERRLGVELVDPLGPVEAAQVVLAEVAQADRRAALAASERSTCPP
jgi:hypothetical protein